MTEPTTTADTETVDVDIELVEESAESEVFVRIRLIK